MGASQNQAGAVLLRAKGAVAPLDLSTVNQVPRALNWKLVAAWLPLIVDGGQAPGHRGGRYFQQASLAPATGGAGQSWIAEGKPWKALGQALCSSLFCHQGSQPLPRVRVARLPLFEAKCPESSF